MMLRLLLVPILLFLVSPGLVAEAIDEYRTTITAYNTGALHIKEVIRYDFGTLQRHGIFRDIPLTVKVDRYAPETPVGLDHFSVKADGKPVPFTRSTIRSKSGGEMVRYRIGDPNKTLTGRHTYTLTYDAKRGVYPSSLAGMEAIRWNAVGSGSNVPTRHAVADLILPDRLDRSRVRINVYTGRYGSTDSRADYHWVDEHHVQFEVHNLDPHEALTVEANYPAGSLDQNTEALQSTFFDRLLGNWHWGAIVGFFLFLYRYARRFGSEDRSGSVAPQYYPPEGLSLLQSGLILDKFADKKDFAAAILELGVLGYLEIHQSGSDTSPIIRRTDKVHADDDLTIDQVYLLDQILFKNRDTYVIKTQDADRAKRINTQLDRVNEMLYVWSVSNGQMQANPDQTRKHFLLRAGLMGVVLVVLSIISLFVDYGLDVAMPSLMAIIFGGVGISVFMKSWQSRAYSGIIFSVAWLGISTVVFGAFLSDFPGGWAAILTSPLLLIVAAGGLVWYFYRRIGLFTPRGLETYRYLLGYRDFMKKVEKDRIRRFLKQDPRYLDRGLPYAVLFGLNDHWIEFYETLNVEQPVWYYGDMHYMDSFSQSVERQSIAPASESGGFSGGGSFSGGGGGGGGVGSW
jgi:uncharacterized membrane protein YgcG